MDLDLYLLVSEPDPRNARVLSLTEHARVPLPIFTFGDRLNVRIYLVNSDGTFHADSANAALGRRLALGIRGQSALAQTSTFTAIANGYSCVLDLDSTQLELVLRSAGTRALALVHATTGAGPNPTRRCSLDCTVLGNVEVVGDAESLSPDHYYTAPEVDFIFAYTRTALLGDVDRRYRFISGVICNTGTGWRFINDVDHRPQGMVSVSVVAGRVRLTYGFTASKVCSLHVTPDETLAGVGMVAGASVGMTFSDVQLSMPLTFNVNLDSAAIVDTPDYIKNKLALVDGTHYQRITHPATDALPVVGPIGSSAGKGSPSLSFSSTQIDIYQHAPLSGYIFYNGAAWVIDTNNRQTVYSAVWDTDHLVVTHDTMQIGNAVNPVPYIDIGSIKIGSVGNTFFHAYFYNAAGVLLTAPSTAMKFWWSRPSLAQVKDLSGYVAISRGYVGINAADFQSVTGNLWVSGIFEVAQ